MSKISAVINTRNEEINIRHCLETLKWCDEIIVVDMESEDRTVEIARRYTDKIYNHVRVIAFDSARKFAVEKATGDWILLIDADELVPKGLATKLRTIAAGDITDIVYIPFKTYIMGTWIRHMGWWPDYHPRFFKKDTVSFVETIHAFMKVNEHTRNMHLPATEQHAIVHFNYRDSEHFMEKLNRYTDIEAQHLFDANKRFSLFRMIGAALREFAVRYFVFRGFKEGYRGFFLSIMMGIYRLMSHIKLWEKWQQKDKPVRELYTELKNTITREYDDAGRSV